MFFFSLHYVYLHSLLKLLEANSARWGTLGIKLKQVECNIPNKIIIASSMYEKISLKKKLHLFQREGKDDAITNSNVISQEIHTRRWAEIQPTIQFILKCSVWTLKGKKCIIKQNVVLRKSDKFETVPDYSFHQIMFKRALHILCVLFTDLHSFL